MKNNTHVLEKLSFDFQGESFLKNIYNKKIHLGSHPENIFFSKQDLKDLFLMDGIEKQFYQINADKGNVFTHPLDPKASLPVLDRMRKDLIDIDECVLELSKGYGLKVYSAHVFSPILKKFSHELFLLFGRGININIYIINGQKEGYALHLDPGAYFIYQVCGAKQWYFPLDGKGQYLKDCKGYLNDKKTKHLYEEQIKDYKTFILREHECLHFPVGQPHYAISKTEKLSIHLTIAIHEYRSIDFANFISSYILHDKYKEPYQCIEQESWKMLFEDDRDLQEKWNQYLTSKNFAILKKGYLGTPSHLKR